MLLNPNSMPQPLPEAWLRGPLPGVPSLLQPAAHALLQAVEEIKAATQDFPGDKLWERPYGVASAGFHLLHIAGVLDRLGTYAKGTALSDEQLHYLARETEDGPQTVQELRTAVEAQVERMLAQLKATQEQALTEPRTVGRKALPSTVQGLLFHAAEHTMRHLGQLLVTVTVLKTKNETE